MTSTSPPSPFIFSALPDYLKAVRERYGLRRKPISLQIWARRLGYRSPRSLELVISGHRLPSPNMTEKLVEDLQLNDRERQYFELMVRRERLLRKKCSVLDIEARMDLLRPARSRVQYVDNEIFRRVSEWYPLVIRELSHTPHFKNDISWIQKRLRGKVSSSQIAFALAEWEGLALDRQAFFTSEDVPSQAVRVFHKKMLQKAIEAIDEFGVEDREYISMSFKSSRKNLEKIKKALRDIRDQFLKDFDQDDGTEVLQLNMVLFPHTEMKK